MSLTDRIEIFCGNYVLKNLKRPFIVALFTLLIVLFIIFSTLSSSSSPCDRILVIDYYKEVNLNNGVRQMPVNLTIAFISDTAAGQSTKDVYRLIKSEGAELIVHSGDFDNDPPAFEADLNEVLGKHFPLIGVIGDHDYSDWTEVPGYQDYLLLRLRMTPNITCSGTVGVNYWCVYRGLYFAFSGVGTICKNNVKILQSELSSETASQFPFKICSWHRNQRLMQVTNKQQDETGYEPYETCRQFGAMIITGHSHCYARSHLLKSTIDRQVQSTKSPYSLTPGNTLVVVNGMGGYSLDNSNPTLAEMPHWGATYGQDNGASFGALFCIYNLNGDPTRALCYFKDINGIIADSFEIVVPGNH